MKNHEPKIKAYIEQIESGKILNNEQKIIKFLRERGGSDIETMRSLLFMKHQTLTSRLSVLEDYGVVYNAGTCKGGKYTFYKFEPNELNRESNRQERQKKAFNNWVKKGLTQFQNRLTISALDELKSYIN